MYPTLETGQSVLVSRLSYLVSQPKIGDIVAIKFSKENKVIIKRVSEIKNNKYFVLGDNKKHSTDSRAFGWIGKKDIIGKVVYNSKVKI